MTKRSIGTALVIALMLSWGGAASAQQAKCLAGKTKCMSKKAGGLLKCEQTAETPGKPTDTSACRAKVVGKFDGGLAPTKGCFEKLENKTGNDCITHDDTAPAEDAVDSCVAAFVAAIDPPPPNQTKCGAGKKKCVSKLLGSLLKCQATAQTPGKPTDQSACIAKAKTKYNGGTESAKGCFAKLEAKDPNDCQPPTNNSDALQTLVEDCVDDLVAVVMTTTTSTTSTTTTTTLACNPVDCDDMNACTTDTCDPATGCVHTPVDCDDHNACTADTCDPATGCVHTPRDCNDDNVCTNDACDPESGVCINTPRDCNDHNACTNDTCDPAIGCVHTNTVCDDHIDCTLDFCDQSSGCINQPDNSFCSTNDPCKVPVCDRALGCTTTDINCNDNNPCTTDVCVAGRCQNAPHNFCNDNLRCTDDVCVPDPQDPGRFSCNSVFDPSNCNLASCQTALCAPGHDCEVVLHDDMCTSTPPASCFANQCTAAGCVLRDICGPANPQCNGCAQCTCSQAQNKCVPSCPS